jgi:hypothetical protein
MRGPLVVVLCALAACGGSQPPAAVTNPPQITATKPTQVFAENDKDFTAVVSGKFLSAKADGSGAPTVSLIRTRDLQGNPVGDPIFSTVPDAPVGEAVDNQAVFAHLHPSGSGFYALSVKTPAGEARVEDYAVLLDPAAVTTQPPPMLCLSTNPEITLQGTFNRIHINPGIATLGDVVPEAGAYFINADGSIKHFASTPETTLQGCRPIAFTGRDISVCSQMTVHFGSAFSAGGVAYQLQVSPGVAGQQVFDLIIENANPPSPQRDILLGAAGTSMPFFFANQYISGSGVAPSATLDGAPVAIGPASCTPALGDKSSCRELDVSIPPGTPAGSHALVLTAAAGCTSAATVVTHVPPGVSIPAGPHCVAGGAMTVGGTSLFNATAFVDGHQVPYTACSDGTCGSVSVSGLSPGDHQLVVHAQLDTTSLDSDPTPFVLSPGPATLGEPLPETLLAGAQRPFFVPMSNKTGPATAAELVDYFDGGVLTADVVDIDGGALVTAPPDAGPGPYMVTAQDESPCSSIIVRGTNLIDLASSPVVASFTFDTDWDSMAFSTLFAETGQPPVGSDSWSATAGNPGGAVIATAIGGPPQYFHRFLNFFGKDLGVLRFDLNACPFGATDALPQAHVKLTGNPFNGSTEFTLSRPIDPPACTFTHYDVPLGGDGWTYTDNSGSRPATAIDFAQIFDGVFIQGNFFTGGNSVALDNVSIELGQ